MLFMAMAGMAMTPWAPDSSSFCYATADGTVLVQQLDGPAPSSGPSGLALAELGMLALAPDAEALDAPEADLAIWSPC